MGSRAARSQFVVVFFALVLAGLGGIFAARANAFEPGTWTPEEQRVFESLQRQTNVADGARARGEIPTALMEEEQAKARRVLTRSARKALPTLGRHLITKTNLAGVAADVWIRNGIVLYNVRECGQTDCPEPLVLDAEFRQAEELTRSGAAGAVFKHYDPAGTLVHAGMVMKAEYEVIPKGAGYPDCRLRLDMSIRSSGTTWAAATYAGMGTGGADQTGSNGQYSNCAGGYGVRAYGDPNDPDEDVDVTKYESGYSRYNHRFFTELLTWPNGNPQWKRTYFGDSFDVGQKTTWESPVFDMGSTSRAGRGAAAGDYPASMEEGKALVDAIEEDDEFNPAWAKPWLLEGFRAPADPREREALWGPVVESWRMSEGRDCKEYEYVTVVCDYPDDHAYVLVEKDWAEWFQYAGGEKDWFFRPKEKPNPAPTETLVRDRRDDVPAVFYRGQTYYDALRVQQDGGFSREILEQRQSEREMQHGPGLYTTRNRAVGLYFADFNGKTYAGQGGAALITIALRHRDFGEMVLKYGVLDNVPVDGVPPGVPPPHVETVFPYASLPELNAKMKFSVEEVPLQ